MIVAMRTIVVGLVLAACGVAFADPTDQADALFEQGKALEKQGQADAACEKYHESLQINPNAIGTILNVALCFEHADKYASAYKLFKDARDRAREQNLPPQQQAAEDHMHELEEQVPHLALAFIEPPTDDTRIVVANVVVPHDQTSDVLVDPGVVTIVVSRPGRITYESKIAIAKAEHKAISIPRLGMPVTVRSGRRTFGKWLMISGAGMVVVGIGIGLDAKYRLYDHYVPSHCPTVNGTPTCDDVGFSRTGTAIDMGWAGTGIGVAGLVVAGIGGYLWYFGPHEDKLAFVPQVDAHQAGIVATGRF